MKSKSKIKKVRILTIALATGLIAAASILYRGDLPSTVRAFGDLTVDFHVPVNDPIFTVSNMVPGDSEDRNVDVTNGGSVAHLAAIKGIRTGGVGSDPKIETALDVVIKDGATPVYGFGSLTGDKTLAQFFIDSSTDDGVQLGVIGSGVHKTFNIKVSLPTSAGNEFQAKSVIFDLKFGIVTANHIVINEVYYQVDSTHGLDSPADRGVSVGGNISISIRDNGAGSVNKVFVDIENSCRIVQTNRSNITNNVGVGINTGSNNANSNTGGIVNISSGSASANININNQVNQTNIATCRKKPVQNHEWIELFNPTGETISLKNWTIVDNSGISRTIPGNRKLNPGQFALISRDNSTWQFWSEDPNAIKIPLGKQIGDGLDNAGDRLILKDSQNNVIDTLSYGDDTSIFNPSIPLVSLGSSFERLVPGFDSDVASDFEERNPPTPGN